MKFGKRRRDADAPDAPEASASVAGSAAPPATQSWTAPDAAQAPVEQTPEPVVEGEAVELPPVEPATPVYEPPVPLTLQGPTPAAMPFPVADQPVGVASGSGAAYGGAHVTSLGDSGEAFASGHAAAPGPNWQEPLMQLADERPEVVVGAAFAGGILAAMILRRLGN